MKSPLPKETETITLDGEEVAFTEGGNDLRDLGTASEGDSYALLRPSARSVWWLPALRRGSGRLPKSGRFLHDEGDIRYGRPDGD